MAKTKAQKQKDYIDPLKTKDRAAYLESEQKQQKKLEQLKKDEATYNLHLQKNRLRKAVKKTFHLVDKLKAGHKASSLLDEVKIS